ncbi:SPOR domain-containing protein [Pollutimonas thiosulfatoxidans]|uniref:Cell division protein n=1 Tax=Pollutimonas thiosulfatoxidans TaxID=2028345 RepID=A0A410GF17_9BURK|nr:SPOR domain-containing protein [Pollutimonas thiosulfatoxidans]MBF6616959.1 SPOR domain-containing protein [Candidimonas sp.]NYT45751.1 SPOR domain-containing protein [Alcaligenaceae bacterium]QAA94845.1 cell division protein [Pollutimonas thiosulfatoxidans]
MARNSRKTTSKSGGSTLFGIMIGLIFGLAAAVAVALFVTQVPMPFVDKASRDPAKTLLPDVRNAPDPNIGLYGKDGAAGVAPTGPTATPPLPLPGVAGANRSGDNLGDLIASLASGDAPPAPARSAPTTTPVPGTEAPATPAPAAAAKTQTTYFLQAGAFRSEKDAEAMKARILLMGLPAEVQQAQSNGATINRVRVGPFKGIDEMNRSRARLGAEKIESSVVRP